MKFTKIALGLVATTLGASAQGLYDFSSLYELDSERSGIEYLAAVNIGYDDNINPVGSECPGRESVGSTYISANIKAGFAHNESNYNFNGFLSLGGRYYLDAKDSDDLNPMISGGFNLTYQINERIRFNSRNYASYGFEPDFERGIAGDSRQGDYLTYSSNNDLGVRWSERFATVHGVGFSGANYFDVDQEYNKITIYNQARYRVTPRTVLTAGYSYDINENSNAHRITGGIEHSLTDRTAFTLSGGVSILDLDNGNSSTSPFVNASIRHTVNERFGLTGYMSYNQDDNFTSLALSCDPNQLFYGSFESRKSLRAGMKGDYKLSENVSFYGGFNVVHNSYQDLQGAVTNSTLNVGDDASALVYNLNAGVNYKLSNSLSLVANYNFTSSTSDDAEPFEYTRNRYSLGLQATF